MKRFLILFFGMFLTFNIFAQTSYKKIETTLENAADVVRSLTTPAELEVSGVMMPLSKSDFGDLVSEIRTQETSIKLDLSKVEGLKEIESETFKDCTSLISVILPDKVTKIGDRGFSNCSNLASVIIPDSVTHIGDCAFELCSSLINVAIPGCATIGVSAFSGCKKLIEFYVDGNNSKYSSSDDRKILFNKDKTTLIAYPSATGNIVIPSSVTTIGEYAFSNCSNLASVIIPNSVTHIGDCAFEYCSNLTNVMLPDSITSIGYVFSYCDNLKYNEYDNGLYLGNNNNPYLVLVEIKNTDIVSYRINSTTKIVMSGAFYKCSNLENITIPDSVIFIGDGVFLHCANLTKIDVSINNKNFSSSDDGKILYNKDKTILIAYPSANGEFIIPDSVTSIGDYAFNDCINLTSITIPDSVVCIGEDAFSGCRNLKNVIIPDSVTKIGSGAFGWCTGLTSVIIPDNEIFIHESAFDNCENLICNKYDNGFYLGNNNNPYLIFIKVKDLAITFCKINDKTKLIAKDAFFGCYNLISVRIPASVVSIGYSAFYNCGNLENVNYKGTKEQWEQINIDFDNEYLTGATINYNYRE